MTRQTKIVSSKDVIPVEIENADTAEYIVAMSEPLRKLALEADLTVVAYLLSMVIEEARANTIPKPQAPVG
ncbi:MAG: hypothetical protein AAF619_03605 [Pseudomonadota bacterium]